MPRRPSSPSDREAVRVLAVSDETSEELLASPDLVRSARLILACGDLPFGYLDELLNALEVRLVFVPGNHDPDVSGYRSSRAGLTLQAGLPTRAPWPDGALNADRRILDVAGLRVAGLGGSPRYSEGPNQYSERQQARRPLQLRGAAPQRQLRDGRAVDARPTHAPPPGIGGGDARPPAGSAARHC